MHEEQIEEATTPARQSSVFEVGQIVDGRYEILSLIGRGGMGLIYRVQQVYVGREFALKTLGRSLVTDLTLRRFQMEAKTAFSLDHPNIISVRDFGMLEEGVPFLVMDIIRGQSLAQRIAADGPMSFNEALPLFAQICDGLAYAHECGVVHRDIKPSNIMLLDGMPLGTAGSVKIVDFGIAKLTCDQNQSLTRTGEVFGSPLYMSPEQAAGAELDQRTDVYSLGCVLFESLTGKPPFRGETAMETIALHRSEKPPRLGDVFEEQNFPKRLDDIVERMLEKDPENRYSNLTQISLELAELYRSEKASSSAHDASASSNTIVVTKGQFIAIVVGVGIICTLVGSCIAYMLLDRDANPGGQSRPERRELEPKLSDVIKTSTTEVDFRELPADRLDSELSKPEVELSNFRINQEGFNRIAANKSLRTLKLRMCSFQEKQLSFLPELPRLEKVDLSNSELTDQALVYLAHCNHLSHLTLRGTKISDQGLAVFQNNSVLSWVDLSDTRISDSGIKNISTMPGLKWLHLANCPVSNASVAVLSKVKLESLDLRGTNVDDDCIQFLLEIETVKHVNLSKTKVSSPAIKRLCTQTKEIKKVEIKECPQISVEQGKIIARTFPNIEFVLK